jgi:hypothetical protein
MLTIIPRSASPEPPRKRQKTAKSVRFAAFVKIVDYVPDKYEYIEDGDENEKVVAPELVESVYPTKDFDFQAPSVRIANQLLLATLKWPVIKTELVASVFHCVTKKGDLSQNDNIELGLLESVRVCIFKTLSSLTRNKTAIILPSTTNLKGEKDLAHVQKLVDILESLNPTPCADAV